MLAAWKGAVPVGAAAHVMPAVATAAVRAPHARSFSQAGVYKAKAKGVVVDSIRMPTPAAPLVDKDGTELVRGANYFVEGEDPTIKPDDQVRCGCLCSTQAVFWCVWG